MNIFGIDRVNVIKRYIKENATLLLILMFCLAVSAYRLLESPITAYDDGALTQMAINLPAHGRLVLQTEPGVFTSGAYMSTGFSVLAPVAATYQLFGKTLLAARLAMIGFLLVFFYTAYALCERLFGKRAALFSLALLATHPSIYAYGKAVLGEVPGLTYLLLALLGIERLSRPHTRTLSLVMLTAVALGLTAAAKPVYLVILPVAAVILLVHRKQLPVNPRTVATAIISLLACLGVWAGTQFSMKDDFANIFFFYRNPGLYADITTSIVMNLKHLFTEVVPLYLLISTILWIISFILRWRDGRNPQVKPGPAESAVLLFTLIIIIAWLRSPGFYRHFFPAEVTSLLALPAVMEDLLKRFVARFPSWNAKRVARNAMTCILLMLIAGHTYRLFFNPYLSKSYRSTQTTQLRTYFDTRFEAWRSPYVYDSPEIVQFLHTTNYTQWIEAAGLSRFAVGPPLDKALARKTDTLIMNEKRWTAERASFSDYHEIAMISRYVVAERNDIGQK
jgi:hypothetical protein